MNLLLSKHTVKKITLICALLTLSACTNQPRQVKASLPLVNVVMEKPTKKMVPNQYWEMLADQNQSILTHPQYQITLGVLYFSALGTTCRELQFKESNQLIKKRVACENNFINKHNKKEKGWFLEKEIIESNRSVEM